MAVVAEEVVALHRKRAMATGFAYSSDTPWQSEIEATFPFEETPDQLTAIADVKKDMESPGPMDRLIFGDVGFGKTEVALRAAFKAVQSGKQVALLGADHAARPAALRNIRGAAGAVPDRVEMLSRFLTGRQQKEVIRGLESGSVDLVIGTHRLLSQDIDFKDLGLLIVDEEQRFGVAAKDKMKRLRLRWTCSP